MTTNMVTEITEGVKVTVSTQYQPDYSSPFQFHFVFTYKIRIENQSDYTVQLLKRHWSIFDSNGSVKEVNGEGVIGIQPVLEPGEAHEYASGCNLKTSVGKMNGFYTFERQLDSKLFQVIIPEFTMFAPWRLN